LTPRWLEMQKTRKQELLAKGMHLAKVECTEAVGLFVEEYLGDAMNQTEIVIFLEDMLVKLKNSTFIEQVKAGGLKSSSEDLGDEVSSPVAKALKEAKAISEAASTGGAKKSTHNPSGEVVHLTADSFDRLTSDENWIVTFHLPGCIHCIKFAPTWDQVAKAAVGKYNIGKVDCSVQKHLCNKFDLEYFPTIKYLRAGGRAVEYKGGRTFKEIMMFLDHLPAAPSFKAVSAAELSDAVKSSDALLVYLYDHERLEAGDLESLAALAATLPEEAPAVYTCPDASVFSRYSLNPNNSPVLLLFKDSGTTRKQYRTPTGGRVELGGEEAAVVRAFVATHGRPAVPTLDARNAAAIMTGPNVTHVVLGLVDRAAPGGPAALDELRTAAAEWAQFVRTTQTDAAAAAEAAAAAADAAADGGDAEAARAAASKAAHTSGFARFVGGVQFAWVDAGVRGDYVARVYGVRRQDLPTFVVARPRQDLFYPAVGAAPRADGAPPAVGFTRADVRRTVEDAISGRLKPKYTFSYAKRLFRGSASLTGSIKELLAAHAMLTAAASAVGLLCLVRAWRARRGVRGAGGIGSEHGAIATHYAPLATGAGGGKIE
ncbi:hypothetical protein HK405_007833, partial [Cladochytrium tenue]